MRSDDLASGYGETIRRGGGKPRQRPVLAPPGVPRAMLAMTTIIGAGHRRRGSAGGKA